MSTIRIERIVVGMLANNVYRITDGTASLVVDPGAQAAKIVEWLGDSVPDAILITHFHADHTGAAHEVRRCTGAPVYASELDAPYILDPSLVPQDIPGRHTSCAVDVLVSDCDLLSCGSMVLKSISTPGHSPGSMCWYAACGRGSSIEPSEDIAETLDACGPFSGVLIAGDTLFEAGCGRTDFELGNPQDMESSLRRLAALPDDTLVLPGHGNATTIGLERNRALRC